MTNVPQDFVNTIMEANAMVPKLTGGESKLGDGNKFHMPAGKGQGSGQDKENQGKGSGDVTGNQEAAKAASNAGPSNDTFSHEAKADPGTSPAANTGLPSNISNKWSMPKTLKDHKETPMEKAARLIEEAASIILESSDDPEFAELKAKHPKKPGEDGVAYVTRLNKHRKGGPPKPAPSLQPQGAGLKAPKKTSRRKKEDAKTEKLLDKVTHRHYNPGTF